MRRGRVSFYSIETPVGTAAGRCRFAWPGKDSEYQKKIGNQTYKGDSGKLRWEPLISILLPWYIWWQKTYLHNTTAAATAMWVCEVGNQSHTMKITHFTEAVTIILSVPNVHFSSSCWHNGLDHTHTPPHPAMSGANFYLFATGCYFCFETCGVTWHLSNMHSCSLYPCTHEPDTGLGHWEW